MSEFIEASGDTVEEAIDRALETLSAREDEVEIQVVAEGSGRGGAKVRARIRDERSPEDLVDDFRQEEEPAEPANVLDPDVAEAQADAAHDFVEGLLDAMGIDAEVESEPESYGASIEIIGSGLAVLIGRHGATLASIQELTRAAVQKDLEGRAVVRVDIEGYMARRQDSLERLAHNMASKVMRTKRPLDMEPMPARDRKIIHDALTRVGGVKTGSEGQEPFRYVVIRPA
jgi:spoIIIJ-associated protein